jgi:hypothetical protein
MEAARGVAVFLVALIRASSSATVIGRKEILCTNREALPQALLAQSSLASIRRPEGGI